MKNKDSKKLQITELFLVKSDLSKTYMGELTRGIDAKGNPVLFGETIIESHKIWHTASDIKKLSNALDEFVCIVLELNQSALAGILNEISQANYYQN